jgi:hypothetical protein
VDEGRHEGLGVEPKENKRQKNKNPQKRAKNSFFVQPSKRESARNASKKIGSQQSRKQ